MNVRLQQFLAAENISQSQFADSIGVARASVSHILAGRNKPGFDFIERMARQYPELNLEWLITGHGRMYDRAKSAPEVPVGPVSPLSDASEDSLFGALPEQPETVRPEPRTLQNPSSESLDRVIQSAINQKSISKLIVFYSDGTFQELP